MCCGRTGASSSGRTKILAARRWMALASAGISPYSEARSPTPISAMPAIIAASGFIPAIR